MLRDERKEQLGEGHTDPADGHSLRAAARLPELSAEGQNAAAAEGQSLLADGGQPELRGEGQSWAAVDGHSPHADSPHPQGAEVGHKRDALCGHAYPADLAPTIFLIGGHYRTRVYAMGQRKRADQSLGAHLRMAVGWRKNLPGADRKRAAAQAAALIDIGEADAVVAELSGQDHLDGRGRRKLANAKKAARLDEPAYAEQRHIIRASLMARRPFDEIEERAGLEMGRLAETLPVWSAFADIRGFSSLALGKIVGEAGDLSAYPKIGHLWKRMGLAVIGAGDGVSDVRQKRMAKTENWEAHGYSAKRRSVMFVIGDSLIKAGSGPYRAIYLTRHATEHQKARAEGLTPATTAKATVESWEERGLPPLTLVKKLDSSHRGAGHMANRAQRYMEKRLLRDLWRAWRQARLVAPSPARPALPAASPALEGERD